MSIDRPTPILFALGAGRDYGERVAGGLGLALSDHEEREFADGERKLRPLVDVRRRAAIVVAPLYGEPGRSPRDKLYQIRLIEIYAVAVIASPRVRALRGPRINSAKQSRRAMRTRIEIASSLRSSQ